MTNSPDETKLTGLIRRRIAESVAVREQLMAESDAIATVAATLISAYQAGKKLLIFGNGGSAADAQHIAAELMGRYYLERRALPAEALTVNTSSLTAIGNDYSFDLIFARQIEALGAAGDVALGISTSGNSANVIEGLRAAKRKGMVTVALTGAGGGRLRAEADHCLCAPSHDTPRIQEAHILIGHILCELIEQACAESEAR
jgi:D-sedoheptulose 7-phosphate isomerase